MNDSRAFDTRDADGPTPGHSGATLRPLDWAELCIRLSAARDLRRDRAGQAHKTTGSASSGRAYARVPGSFHRGAAGLLEHLTTGKHAVNPNHSTSGKDHQGIELGNHLPSETAPQERRADENCHD